LLPLLFQLLIRSFLLLIHLLLCFYGGFLGLVAFNFFFYSVEALVGTPGEFC